MKIEVGKYYKDRTGQVLGPVRHNNDDDYPFEIEMDGHYRSFATDGSYMLTQKTSGDLIEECNADGSPVVVQSNPLTADRSWRDEIALRVLPGLLSLGSDLECDDLPPTSTLGEIAVHHAFYIADVFLKAAKQS